MGAADTITTIITAKVDAAEATAIMSTKRAVAADTDTMSTVTTTMTADAVATKRT